MNATVVRFDEPRATVCGLQLTDGAWIDWTPSTGDPRCPACHGVTVDEQEPLL